MYKNKIIVLCKTHALADIQNKCTFSYLYIEGGTIAGKSVCEDLCFSGNSWTSSTGPVRNPHDPTRSTGGSSSGSASLVSNVTKLGFDSIHRAFCPYIQIVGDN